MGEDNKILRTLGDNISTARKQCHLTQEELAYRINKSDKYVSMVERGASGVSITALVRLCEALNVTPSVLFNNIVKYDNLDIDTQIIDKLSVLTPADKEFLLEAIDFIIQKGSK